MKKKNFSIVCSLFFPFIATAQATFIDNGIAYVEDLSDPSKLAVIVISKKSPLLSEYMSAYEGDIIVPSQVEHDLDIYEVSGIAQGAFICQELESLIINDGPTKIINGTIYSPVLKKLVFPNTMKSIEGITAMELEEIEFGNSLQSAKLCTLGNLEILNFPKSLKKLDMVYTAAMNGDYKLKNITLGEDMDFMKTAFTYFNGQNLEIPSCKSIENSFMICENLKTFTIKEGLQSLKNSFTQTENLESLIIPSSCRNLENSFRTVHSLNNLEIKDGLESISSCFTDSRKLPKLILPGSLKSIDESFGNLYELEEIIINNGPTSIKGSFSGTKLLKKLILPKSVKVIENSFGSMDALEELVIENGVESIVNSCKSMKSLKKLTIPASIMTLISSFTSANNLEKLNIQTVDVTDFGDAFNSRSLNDITVSWTTPPTKPKFINYAIIEKGFKLNVPKGTSEAYIKAWGLQSGVDSGKIIVIEK